ncbi:MAG: hypothetical protein H6Q90_178 [Deltaproteobacteria bacterium]|nr:hypothetical protein [Deltaproteobacteria bacterium]
MSTRQVICSMFLLGCVLGGCAVDPDSGAVGEGEGDGDGKSDAVDPTTKCLGQQAGRYCGDDQVANGDPSLLYTCSGAGRVPTSALSCPAGCVTESAGVADHCRAPTPSGSDTFRLPWKPAVTMRLTQDCNDSCCGDHVGTDRYSYDWSSGGEFTIVAARGGTISHLKINSTTGCGTSGCVNQANMIVIDHGDGTQSTYLHLKGNSLAPGILCGGTVVAGQPLAQAGTTGWSTGIHLHYQVSGVHAGATTCECGADGRGCSAGYVPWGSFWVNATYPSLAKPFDEWPVAASCANRRIVMPTSQNE